MHDDAIEVTNRPDRIRQAVTSVSGSSVMVEISVAETSTPYRVACCKQIRIVLRTEGPGIYLTQSTGLGVCKTERQGSGPAVSVDW